MVKAARKTAKIHYRGANFTLSVEDHPEHDGHMLVQMICDKPPTGLDKNIYTLVMRWPKS